MASDRHLALGSSRKHAHWWCVMFHCSDPVQVEGRSCMRSSPLSWLLCSWVVMNIINPTYVTCVQCTQMCIVGKGLKVFKVLKLLRYAAVLLTFNCIYLLFLYIGAEPQRCNLHCWICSWCSQLVFGIATSSHCLFCKCCRPEVCTVVSSCNLICGLICGLILIICTVASSSGVEVHTGCWTVLSWWIRTSVWVSNNCIQDQFSVYRIRCFAL